MAARVKRSGVWEYFVLQVTDDSKVSCSLCNAVISRGGKSYIMINIGYRYLYRYRQYVLLIIGIVSYRHFTLSVEH